MQEKHNEPKSSDENSSMKKIAAIDQHEDMSSSADEKSEKKGESTDGDGPANAISDLPKEMAENDTNGMQESVETDEAKKIVESMSDESGARSDRMVHFIIPTFWTFFFSFLFFIFFLCCVVEESTKEIIKKAASAVSSLKPSGKYPLLCYLSTSVQVRGVAIE